MFLGIPGRKWDQNICVKMKGEKDTYQWRALVSTVINFGVT